MNAQLAKSIVEVIRNEKHRRVSLLDNIHPDVAYDQWLFTDAPFVAELCLMLLVALRHQLERELIHLAACASDGGNEISRQQYQKRVLELQSSKRKGWDWKQIHARLNLRSCAGEKQIEALRLLANSYKHDPSKTPDHDLLKLLGLTTTVTYAALPESDGLQEGLAVFIGLSKDADYCDIAERFITLVQHFTEDVRRKTQLSRIKRGGASLTDLAR